MTRRRPVTLLAVCLGAVALAGAAGAATVTTVLSNLDNPRGLAFAPEGTLYVAEAGRGGAGPCVVVRGQPSCYGPSGAISRLRSGVQERWVAGLPSLAPASGAEASGPDDISFLGLGGAYVTTGLGLAPAARDQLGADAARLGRLLKLSASGEQKEVADLAAFEATANPDGGLLDSNPYGVLALPGRQLVADAGANAVLQVGADGDVKPLAAFGRRQNPLPLGPPFVESVPTAVAQGPDGALYVSELTGAPFVGGFARIHRLAPDGTTSVIAVGLTAVVDLAFAEDGALYALQHSSCGPFFACPGSIVRVGAGPPHAVVHGGLNRPSAFTIGPDGAFYVSNNGASAGVGEVLRIVP